MKYTQKYRIYENDVDFRKMATLGSLLRYCQQIGTEDAEHYGITPELYASTHTSYVLAKLALHITRTPRVEETITVQTEPEALHRAVNRRFTTFCDAQGREEVCVDSRWVLIDTDKRMILRKHPEGFPTTGWVDKLDRELPIKLTKVKREDCEELGTHRAVYSRCDRNGHMNNTVYADLICDALPLEVWRTHTVTDVILYYHKEVPMAKAPACTAPQWEKTAGIWPGGRGIPATLKPKLPWNPCRITRIDGATKRRMKRSHKKHKIGYKSFTIWP